jgi:nicotinamidase-related amidase
MITNCLIVIDMQNDFLEKLEVGDHARLILNTNQLIDVFRVAGCPVIWVQQLLSRDLSDAPLLIRDRGISVVIDGTPGARIHSDLARNADDTVVIKKRYSAFFGTDLEEILRDLAPERVTLAGVNTHACVRATAIDAYQRDIRVLLASDCLASHDPEHGRISMAYMDRNIALAMTNKQIADDLTGRGVALGQ